MRLTIFFIMAASFYAHSEGYSQSITLSENKASLEKLFKDTRSQSGYFFFYDKSLLKKAKPVTVRVKNAPLESVLDICFKDQPLTFNIIGQTIVVKERKIPAPEFSISPLDISRIKIKIQKTITGKVTDNGGKALEGVSVVVKGTMTGTTTDNSGKYVLTVEDNAKTLVFSMIGYDTREVSINEAQNKTIVLQQAASSLSEVSVTGYSLRPQQSTGAISTIGANALENRSIQTPDQALQGRVNGVRLINTNGQPGGNTQIRIRGIGSINGGQDPLYIVDGVRLEASFQATQASMNILQSLNPEDIERIDVLKDADATSIYGADGSNGVVLITTKHGRKGSTKFRLTSQFGVAKPKFRYDLMNGPDFARAMIDAFENRYEDLGTSTFGGVNYGDPNAAGRAAAISTYGDPDSVGTYDWQGAMEQTGLQQRVSLSASGGGDKSTYYLSGGYDNQGGTVINSHFDRKTLNFSFSHDASKRLTFNLKANLSSTHARGQVDEEGETDGTNWTNSPFHGGITTRVTSPIYAEDGSFNQNPTDLAGVNYNMVQVLNLEKKLSNRNQLIGSFAVLYKISDYLSFRTRWNIDYRLDADSRFEDPRINRYGTKGGLSYRRDRKVTNFSTDNVLDYARTLGGAHHIHGILGVEYNKMHRDEITVGTNELPSYLFTTVSAGAVASDFGGTWNDYKKAGAFSRVEYDYNNKYIASASFRRDGSSRFGLKHKWGSFYSVGLAWDMTKESFLNNVDWVTRLKPKISYGTTGNSDIGNFASRALFGVSGSYDGKKAIRPSQLGNDFLTWEVARTLDLSIDWSLFNGKVYGNFDVFRTINDNLLLDRNLPTNSGFSSITDNVGSVRNQGFEGLIGTRILDIGIFSWTSEFNITFLGNKIIDLGGQQNIGNTIRLGQPIQIRWGYFDAGVNPANGKAMWYDKEGNLTYSPSSTNDRGIIGSQFAKVYGGFDNRFRIGSFSVEMLFYYEYGRNVYSVQGDQFFQEPYRGRNLLNKIWDLRWQKPGDITYVPRFYSVSAYPGTAGAFLFGTNNMQDASFIRLKNININYTLPKRWFRKSHITNLSVFAQVENAITWTKFDGPEVETIADTRDYYPQPRVFTGGVVMNF